MIRNPHTVSVSPNFHLVYDGWLQTVPNVENEVCHTPVKLTDDIWDNLLETEIETYWGDVIYNEGCITPPTNLS